MKDSLSSVDIAVIVRELQAELIGARVEKVYQIGKEELRFKLHQRNRGSIDLLIEAGRRIHTTKYRRKTPQVPSNFAMLLRKRLGGCHISGVQQLEFDRIVELKLRCRDGEFSLIAELLPKGNIILTDARGEILQPLRRMRFSTREIKAHERYERPPSRVNPLRIPADELKFICKNSDKDVVRTLAWELSLGGVYSEEVCERAGIDKAKRACELDDTELRAIWDAIHELLKPLIESESAEEQGLGLGLRLRPHIVLENGERVDVQPLELHRYREAEKIFFPSFNDAVDEYFTEKIAECIEAAAETEHERRIARYERILKEQEAALREFQAKEDEWRRKGELIYARCGEIEELLHEMREKSASANKSKIVEITLPEGRLEIDTSKSLFSNASLCYERAKLYRKKREGVERAMEETMANLERARAEEVATGEGALPEKRDTRRGRGEWYERFRWFVTAEGVLVIGGRDATTNEILVKKYMSKDDLFCHTQASGAPVVIVKTGDVHVAGHELSDASLRAIAQFAASYSSLWKYGFYEGECYFVRGEQVSKRPPAGEYIAKGSFMVRGRRRYVKVPLGLCIGIDTDVNTGDSRPVARPELDKNNLQLFVVLEPGDELDKNTLANVILEFFTAHGSNPEEITHDRILSLLPPGKSRIKARSGGGSGGGA